jgi:hypothetical protein
MTNRIFICYRRKESGYSSGWLYELLKRRFGAERLFKDLDDIRPGDDFPAQIEAALRNSVVMLAFISPSWSSATGTDGSRRLDDPDDPVRVELETALRERVAIIPVLVDDARMPTREELPQTLTRLTRLQAVELTHSRFNADAARLLDHLERLLAARPPVASEGTGDEVTDPADRPKTLASPPVPVAQPAVPGAGDDASRGLSVAVSNEIGDRTARLAHLRATSGRDHPSTLAVAHSLVEALWREGDDRGALALAWDTWDQRVRTLGAGHVDSLESLRLLGRLLAAMGLRKDLIGLSLVAAGYAFDLQGEAKLALAEVSSELRVLTRSISQTSDSPPADA